MGTHSPWCPVYPPCSLLSMLVFVTIDHAGCKKHPHQQNLKSCCFHCSRRDSRSGTEEYVSLLVADVASWLAPPGTRGMLAWSTHTVSRSSLRRGFLSLSLSLSVPLIYASLMGKQTVAKFSLYFASPCLLETEHLCPGNRLSPGNPAVL